MRDQDRGVRFDHDPTLPQLDRPLRKLTQDFMQRFRATKEFHSLLPNQMAEDQSADGKNVGLGELGAWGQGFIDRIYGISTPADADRLLLPWQQWSEIHGQLWDEYVGKGGGKDNYDEMQRKFAAAGIPEDLKEQMGEMPEDKLRFNAEFYLFRFTRVMREAIDMTEGLPRPVSADTVFRVQRVMGEPVYPEGGLHRDEIEKPDVRRIEQDGKHYIAFYLEGEEPIIAYEDRDGDPDWERWSQLKIGSHVAIVPTGDHEIDSGGWGWKPGESGTVYGYSVMGAGDRMLLQPSVGHIALLARDDRTDFLRSALVRQSRLDTELQTPTTRQIV